MVQLGELLEHEQQRWRDPEHRREYWRKYRERNREGIKEYNKIYMRGYRQRLKNERPDNP